ncbi:MAG: four helix bundle protein [Thermodesulfovibrionales bacterium]|nr:four helix bundle protein [Thermodesulfovibrionales bacterium]
MKKAIQNFEDLNIWQRGRELVGLIYELTKKRDFLKDYSLIDQIRRSSISVMSNIAEGFERGSNKEFIQFLYIAKGSCGEVRSQLYVALDQRYVSEGDFSKTKEFCLKISGMINNLISYLKTSNIKGAKHKITV